MDKVIEILARKCKPYIDVLKTCERENILIRGSNDEIRIIKKFKHNLENRYPRNMPINIHNCLNTKYENVFNWKIRNGVFCYGCNLAKNVKYNLGYGPNYIMFPIGEFEFVYSPNIFDLFEYFSESDKIIKDKLNDLCFSAEDLNEALKSGEDGNDFSNEISLKTSEYFLVNFEFKDKIIEMIWG